MDLATTLYLIFMMVFAVLLIVVGHRSYRYSKAMEQRYKHADPEFHPRFHNTYRHLTGATKKA